MSSTGQIVGGIVGAVVGYFAGNPVLGAQIGMSLGGLIDPPSAGKVQGPRVNDLTAQTSTYGAFIPRIYGTAPVVGNIFWIQGNKLIEKGTTTGGDGKGGPSTPETTTFEYFSTFAVGLCEGPIDGVRRIWIGGQLWYDAGSDDLATIISGSLNASTFTLYTGTDTQLADPLIQADHGVANVPAYRGLAYIVFNELPLKGYGNSLAAAQVKVEVVSNGSVVGPHIVNTFTLGTTPRVHGASAIGRPTDDGIMTAFVNREGLYTPGLTDVYLLLPDGTANQIGTIQLDSEGTHFGGWSTIPCAVTANNSGRLTVQDQFGMKVVSCDNYYGGSSNSNFFSYYHNGGEHYLIDFGFLDFTKSIIYQIVDGYGIYDGKLQEVFRSESTDVLGLVHDIFVGENEIYAITQSKQFVCFDMGWSVNWMVDMSAESGLYLSHFGGNETLIRSYVDGQIVLTSHNLAWRVTSSGYTYLGAVPSYASGYENFGGDHVVGNLWVSYHADDNKWHYIKLDGLTGAGATLSTIVQSECLKSDLLTAADLDVTDLTDQVRGYRISSLAPLRGGIDPLRKAWPFDAIQHGYKIKFKRRGGASVATITEGELDARAAGASPGVQIANTREMDLVLPKQLTAQYLDATREYDVNVAEESRQ